MPGNFSSSFILVPRTYAWLLICAVGVLVLACGSAAAPTELPSTPSPAINGKVPPTNQGPIPSQPVSINPTPEVPAPGILETPPPTAPRPHTGPPDSSQVESPAPIESVAINLSEASSGSADLVIVSGLPNACFSFGGYAWSREDDRIEVSLTNLKLDDPSMMCAMIYGSVTTEIGLGVGFEACTFYKVVVNGESYSVQAIQPDLRCQGPELEEVLEVAVGLGETVSVADGRFSITLLEVVKNSLCPRTAECIWAGQGEIEIRIEREGREPRVLGMYAGEGYFRWELVIDEFVLQLADLHGPSGSSAGKLVAYILVSEKR